MRRSLKSSRILIVGLVKNCARSIKGELEIINHAFSDSEEIKWLIIESDSSDNSIQELEEAKQIYNLNFYSLGKLEERFPLRTERIAFCRNKYIKEIQNDKKYSTIDFVVVADLDGVNTSLNIDSVRSCWEVNVDWDGCFANQLGPYYDIWALRHPIWSPNDCFEHEKFLTDQGVNPFMSRYFAVYSRMIKILTTAKPIKVVSAFGGMGIYKKKLFENNSYIGVNQLGEEICEHVSFHENLKKANLFIIPSFINCSWNEHSKPKRIYNIMIVYFLSMFFSKKKLSKLKNFIK